MYLTNVILGVATIFRRLQTIKALVQSAKVQRAQYEKCEWAGLKKKSRTLRTYKMRVLN